jgi:hypothetical protein
MNHDHIPMSDDQLVRLLGAALDAAEPVPDAALQAAYAAVAMDRLHEELAALVFDSASDRQLVAMRSQETQARLLSFANDHLSIDLELHADARTVVGQISPPSDGRAELEAESGEFIDLLADEFGRFRVLAPVGPFRLRVVGVLVTPWVTR